jgi:hypothetical protein
MGTKNLSFTVLHENRAKTTIYSPYSPFYEFSQLCKIEIPGIARRLVTDQPIKPLKMIFIIPVATTEATTGVVVRPEITSISPKYKNRYPPTYIPTNKESKTRSSPIYGFIISPFWV